MENKIISDIPADVVLALPVVEVSIFIDLTFDEGEAFNLLAGAAFVVAVATKASEV